MTHGRQAGRQAGRQGRAFLSFPSLIVCLELPAFCPPVRVYGKEHSLSCPLLHRHSRQVTEPSTHKQGPLFPLEIALWLAEQMDNSMEGAFTHVGNHLVSDSASAINAGDDLSALDPDESLLDREFGKGNLGAAPRRRRHDDEETDVLEDDDAESMVSMPVNGKNAALGPQVQEEIELPPHACA